MIGAIQSALSGLMAASTKMKASADNIANMDTVGSLDPEGQPPYDPLTTVQQAQPNGGVTASNVPVPKAQAFSPAFDPNSPFANADGLVGAPNVDLAGEAVNMMIAKIAYKANLATIKTEKDMQDDLLNSVDKKI